MKNSITYVAMDTHKKEHKVALHYPGDEEIVQFVVKNTVSDIRKMVNKIKNKTPATRIEPMTSTKPILTASHAETAPAESILAEMNSTAAQISTVMV